MKPNDYFILNLPIFIIPSKKENGEKVKNSHPDSFKLLVINSKEFTFNFVIILTIKGV